MSQFTAEILLEPNDDGTTVKVHGGFRYYIGYLSSNEYIDVEHGFVSDGVTLPPILCWLRPFVPRWQYAKAVIVHDKLCKETSATLHILRAGGWDFRHMPRAEIDREFKTALIALGCPKFKAQIYYLGVRAWFYYTQFKQHLKAF